MQLAHLIPHLDAEIDRLQRARDLLQIHHEFLQALPPADTSAPSRHAAAEKLAEAVVDDNREKQAAKMTGAATSEAAPLNALASSPIVRLGQRRSYTRSSPAHPDRRRRTVITDTALRGAVPAGPVAVSAEEARRSQAAKAAQITRAAEVRKAGDEPAPGAGWRSQGDTARQMQSLLQRLMNIGEASGEDAQLTLHN